MRISLILFFFPFLLLGQSENSGSRRDIRIGMLYQFDASVSDYYASTDDGPLLRLQRPVRPNLVLDAQIFRRFPHLYLTAAAGYYTTSTSTQDIPEEERFFVGRREYIESVEVNYWQWMLGLNYELFGSARFSPYVHSNLLLALPTRATYDIQFTTLNRPDDPLSATAEGGVKPSLGYMIRSGIAYAHEQTDHNYRRAIFCEPQL